MKKKMVTLVAMGVCMSLCACGGKAETSTTTPSTPVATDVVVEETSVVEETTTVEETITVEETTTEEETTTVEEVQLTFFEENGLVATPAGDFTFKTQSYAKDADGNITEYAIIDVPSNVTYTSSTENVPEGFERKTLTVVFDKSNVMTGWHWATAVFDRYTGATLSLGDTVVDNANVSELQEIGETIVYDGVEYTVTATKTTERGEGTLTQIYEIVAPVEYDGGILKVGYNDEELIKASEAKSAEETATEEATAEVEEIDTYEVREGYDSFYFEFR